MSWFSDLEVKKDDLVVLYTKAGILKTTENDTGHSSHFFYWGNSLALLEGSDAAIVLVSAEEWTASSL